MRAVDTNIIVRYLAGGDPRQTQKTRAIIGREPIFVPRTVMLETEWVLRSVYELPLPGIIEALRALCGLPGVLVEDAAWVAKALDWAEAGMDFADALHLAAASGCESFLTFDKQFARLARNKGPIPVSAP